MDGCGQLPLNSASGRFPTKHLDGAILVYNYHFEQSVCNFFKRRTQPPVFSGEIFKTE